MKNILHFFSSYRLPILVFAFSLVLMGTIYRYRTNPEFTFWLLTVIVFVLLISILTWAVQRSQKLRKMMVLSSFKDDEKNIEKSLSADIEFYQETYNRLAQAEQRLQAIVNLIPHAISVEDQTGKIILANQCFADFFGKRRRDIVGQTNAINWSDSFEAERLKQQDKEVIASYQSQTISTWLTDYKNQKRLYNIHKVPVVDPVLDEPVLLGMSIDISESFFREQLLHSRSRVLESIVESGTLERTLNLLISEMKLRLDCDEVSFLKIHKDKLNLIASSSLGNGEYVIDENIAGCCQGAIAEAPEFIQKILNSSKVLNFDKSELAIYSKAVESCLQIKNIEVISGKVIADSDDNILGLIIISHAEKTKVTEKYRKIVNETILLAALSINKITADQNLKQFNDVVANSQSAIFFVGSDGIIDWANKSFGRVFGVDVKSMINQPIDILRPDGEMGEAFDEMTKALKYSSSWRSKISICTPERVCMPFQASVNPSLVGDGRTIVILQEVSDEQRIRHEIEALAFYDSLTGLHNRGLLFERLQQTINASIRNKSQLALLLLDLDYFKKVNESAGHASGDVVLQEVAKRIRNTVRKEDIIARIDGDEFAIVVEGFKDPAKIRNLASKLMDNICKPVIVQDKKIFLSVSIGIGVGPDDGKMAEDLVRNVSMALFRAKANGRKQIEFYEYELNLISQDKLNLEAEMRDGLLRNEFFLVFQPIYSCDGTKIVAAEALMRWKNPKRGFVSPMEFIPIAEETGLIDELGDLAFVQTAKMLSELAEDAVKIRVNLSARQFESGQLPEKIKLFLENNKISSDLLGLELTESLLMDVHSENLQQLEAIRALGISIAIDDFGTGYSSLSYLKTFPVDVLKIDRSFIQELKKDAEDRSLVDTILAIAQKLEMGAIAEGVETFEQLQLLKEMDFSGLQLQGFFLSKPLMSEALLELITSTAHHKNILKKSG